MFLSVHFGGSFSLFSGLFLVKLIVSSLTWRPRERPSLLSWAVLLGRQLVKHLYFYLAILPVLGHHAQDVVCYLYDFGCVLIPVISLGDGDGLSYKVCHRVCSLGFHNGVMPSAYRVSFPVPDPWCHFLTYQ